MARVKEEQPVQTFIAPIFVAIITVVILHFGYTGAALSENMVPERAADLFLSSSLIFEANQGQLDSQVKFRASGQGYNVFLTSHEVVLLLKAGEHFPDSVLEDGLISHSTGAANAILRMRFLEGQATPQLIGQDQSSGMTHYLMGQDATQWRVNVDVSEHL